MPKEVVVQNTGGKSLSAAKLNAAKGIWDNALMA